MTDYQILDFVIKILGLFSTFVIALIKSEKK